MLTDECLAIAELISKHDRLSVLAQNVCIGTGWGVHRLNEKAELQKTLLCVYSRARERNITVTKRT
jgi:hypothetical protein